MNVEILFFIVTRYDEVLEVALYNPHIKKRTYFDLITRLREDFIYPSFRYHSSFVLNSEMWLLCEDLSY